MANRIYSASETTPNLQLPVYHLNDRLSVSDFNSAMEKIDTAVTENKTDISDASNLAQQAVDKATAVEASVTQLQTDLECTQEKVRQHTTEIQDLNTRVDNIQPTDLTELTNKVNQAQTTATQAQVAANQAQQTANSAVTSSQNAQNTANEAKQLISGSVVFTPLLSGIQINNISLPISSSNQPANRSEPFPVMVINNLLILGIFEVVFNNVALNGPTDIIKVEVPNKRFISTMPGSFNPQANFSLTSPDASTTSSLKTYISNDYTSLIIHSPTLTTTLNGKFYINFQNHALTAFWGLID